MRQLPPPPASFFNFLLWCIFGALNILCFCDCNHTIGNISMSQLQTKVKETVNREQLLSYSGEHLHLIILISVPEEIDWLSFFFQEIQWDLGASKGERRQGRRKRVKSILKIFLHYAAVRPRTLLPVYCHKASKAWQSWVGLFLAIGQSLTHWR